VMITMTEVFNRIEVKEKRRALRKEMPPAEVILWKLLRGKGLCGRKFRRQYSIGPYIVDFYCPQEKLAIEIDGESHFVEGAEIGDRERQKYIEAKGIHVLRFTNTDVYERLEGVVIQIASRLPLKTSPNPSL
jgi:very-short-patch-repair endonuclease